MATATLIDFATLLAHPAAVYRTSFLSARTQVFSKILDLQDAANDPAHPEHSTAVADGTTLTSELGLMDEADQAYTVRLLIGPFGPKQDVVDRTVELNAELAELVVKMKRAQAYIHLVTQWVTGVTAVVTGQADAIPPLTPPA